MRLGINRKMCKHHLACNQRCIFSPKEICSDILKMRKFDGPQENEIEISLITVVKQSL